MEEEDRKREAGKKNKGEGFQYMVSGYYYYYYYYYSLPASLPVLQGPT